MENLSSNQDQLNPNAEAWNEFLPPAVPELPDNKYYPPATPELPDNHREPSVTSEDREPRFSATLGSSEKDRQSTALDAPKTLRELQTESAVVAGKEISRQAGQERQKLEDAYRQGTITEAEYLARKQVIDYYAADRLDKIRSDYNEINNDPALRMATDRLAEFNDSVATQSNEGELKIPRPNQLAQPTQTYMPDQLRDMVLADVRDHIRNQKNANQADDNARAELEAKARHEAEARARHEAEQRAEREAEIKQTEEKNAALEQELNDLKAKEAELKARAEQGGANAEMIKRLEVELKNAKEEVARWRDDLAESYAKNRGLLVGNKNRKDFAEKQDQYKESLSRYLRIQARLTEKRERARNAGALQPIYDELASKLAAGEISAEEANEALGSEWAKMEKKLKTDISSGFVGQYLAEQQALENKTIDRIDNGNFYRKAVSKIINNKPLKAVLATAGIVGLAATGVGLATGAVALGVSYTAGGVAFGAGKGALSGLFMSRQDSKNSAVRSFAGSREEIEKQLRDIDVTGNGANVENVTNWLLKRYDEANQVDHSSNIKRTAIAMGLGAAIGGATSGIQINQVKTEYKDHADLVGHKSTEYKATNLESLSHKKGTGTQQLFRELGGDGDTYYSSGAHKQMAAIIEKYGMTVGENDWTYPGPISEWPETARQAFSEVADEWAKKGLVAATKIGGEPIYNVKADAITTVIADRMHNFFVGAGSVVGAGILGGAVSGRRNQVKGSEQMPSVSRSRNTISPLPFEAFEITQSTSPSATESATVETNLQASDQNTGNAESGPRSSGQNADVTESGSQILDQNVGAATLVDAAVAIRDRFLDSVKEEGVSYMTYEGGAGPDFNDRVFNWWQTLTPEVRQDVIEYEKTTATSSMGSALRGWLKMQDLL